MEQRISTLEKEVAVIATEQKNTNTRLENIFPWIKKIEDGNNESLTRVAAVEQKQESNTERILERLDQLHQNQKTQSERRWKLITIVLGIVATLAGGGLALLLGLK